MAETIGYWMHETSGVLRPVVEAYLRGDDLTPRDIATLRAYLRQWMAGPWRGPMIDVLRTQVDHIICRRDVRDWLDRALQQGIDPL